MIQIEELQTSRSLTTGQRQELVYSVTGTDDEAAAVAAVEAERPATLNGLRASSTEIRPVFIDTLSPAICRWEATVNYVSVKRRARPDTGESVYNFEISGSTMHVTQSLGNVSRHAPAGQTAPDFKGAINVTDEGVAGVEIQTGRYSFSETHYLAAATVNDAFKAALAAAAWKVNAAPFKGFAAGEVLFIGASGSKRGSDDWEITYRFDVSKNATGIQVGGITGIVKGGWDLLWVRYKTEKDSTANVLVRVPEFVYIEKMYNTADFSTLGI